MYFIECLEVGPAQAGTALAAPHILHLILTIGHMGHRHLANPAPHEDTPKHDLKVKQAEGRCEICQVDLTR